MGGGYNVKGIFRTTVFAVGTKKYRRMSRCGARRHCGICEKGKRKGETDECRDDYEYDLDMTLWDFDPTAEQDEA